MFITCARQPLRWSPITITSWYSHPYEIPFFWGWAELSDSLLTNRVWQKEWLSLLKLGYKVTSFSPYSPFSLSSHSPSHSASLSLWGRPVTFLSVYPWEGLYSKELREAANQQPGRTEALSPTTQEELNLDKNYEWFWSGSFPSQALRWDHHPDWNLKRHHEPERSVKLYLNSWPAGNVI